VSNLFMAETLDACGEAHTELSRIIEATHKQAALASCELLHAAQLDPEVQKTELGPRSWSMPSVRWRLPLSRITSSTRRGGPPT